MDGAAGPVHRLQLLQHGADQHEHVGSPVHGHRDDRGLDGDLRAFPHVRGERGGLPQQLQRAVRVVPHHRVGEFDPNPRIFAVGRVQRKEKTLPCFERSPPDRFTQDVEHPRFGAPRQREQPFRDLAGGAARDVEQPRGSHPQALAFPGRQRVEHRRGDLRRRPALVEEVTAPQQFHDLVHPPDRHRGQGGDELGIGRTERGHTPGHSQRVLGAAQHGELVALGDPSAEREHLRHPSADRRATAAAQLLDQVQQRTGVSTSGTGAFVGNTVVHRRAERLRGQHRRVGARQRAEFDHHHPVVLLVQQSLRRRAARRQSFRALPEHDEQRQPRRSAQGEAEPARRLGVTVLHVVQHEHQPARPVDPRQHLLVQLVQDRVGENLAFLRGDVVERTQRGQPAAEHTAGESGLEQPTGPAERFCLNRTMCAQHGAEPGRPPRQQRRL